MLAVVGTTPGCGASGGAPAKAAWGTAECRSQVLRLPAEPLVVEMRGALRCRRDHVFEDEREHRVDEEVIDYGPLSCLSGCPAGYEAQWFPLRLTLTPAGSLIVEVVGEGAPTTGAEEERGDAAASVGRLDEGGCFHAPPAGLLVRWDEEGRLLSPHLDEPLPVRLRDGRLELLSGDRVEHVLSVRHDQVLVNGVPCGSLRSAPGPLAGELSLRILPLADLAGGAEARDGG